MKLGKLEKCIPDNKPPTKEELEYMQQMEEAYQQWSRELDEAIAAGDQERADELYELGK